MMCKAQYQTTEIRHTKIMIIKILPMVLISINALAADKPDLKIADGLPKLSLSFADNEVWSGKKWLRVQQCANRGGIAPLKSPELKVSGAPKETKQLVVFFNNARAMHNHGLFSFQAKSEDGSYLVPAVSGGATSKLPAGVALFQGGSSWGAAYNPACPTGGSWKYSVTVYALNEQEQVVAAQELDIGWAE